MSCSVCVECTKLEEGKSIKINALEISANDRCLVACWNLSNSKGSCGIRGCSYK